MIYLVIVNTNQSYCHHQIGNIQLSHCCHIVPWLCVWDVRTIIFCRLLHIYSGNTGTLFPLWTFSLWYLQMIWYIMTCMSCSLCRLIWRHWTTKMLVSYMLPSVYLWLRPFSQWSFIQYIGLGVFILPTSHVIIVIMGTLSYYHHQIGGMNHQPLFTVRSWINGTRCMSYYVPPVFKIEYANSVSHQYRVGCFSPPNKWLIVDRCVSGKNIASKTKYLIYNYGYAASYKKARYW